MFKGFPKGGSIIGLDIRLAHVILRGQEEFMVGHLVSEIQHPIAIWKLEGWKRVELIKSPLSDH